MRRVAWVLSGAGGRHELVTNSRAAAAHLASRNSALPRSVTLFSGAANGTVKGYQLAAERAAETLGQAGIDVRISNGQAGGTELAESFVVLPGGASTLMEFFEVWTGQQRGAHARPVALLNINGFFDGLLKAIDQMIIAGFLGVPEREALIVASDAHDLLGQLATWHPPVGKLAEAS